MRKLKVLLLIAMSALICVRANGSTNPAPEQTKTDKMEAARKAEEKGDLARIHGSFLLAAAYYQAALRVDRHDVSLYNKLGISELQLRDLKPARKSFQAALKLDPQSVSAINNLGVVDLLSKKYRSALDYFKQALALDESSATTHVNLAETWLGLHETDRAMTEYTRALELDADVLTESVGGSQIQLTSPEQRARISYLIAKSYMRRGNLDGALDYLGRARDLHFPDLAKVYTDPDFAPLWKDPRLAKVIKG
jgi:tetratricopeptide (TPR) repeat protein